MLQSIKVKTNKQTKKKDFFTGEMYTDFRKGIETDASQTSLVELVS